ncbi:hypothetical protein [Solibacillus sp. CAU 1738]|uniref:hypothetical protein n=1 Tax=Solibacillus sp. CAU 1738 TaxID=3140363 RepID=UPI003260D3AE
MTRKKIIQYAGIIIVLISVFFIYWFNFSKPISFPPNEQLVEEINSQFPEANASIIQDAIHLDERHVLVPFVSKSGDYSLSYWLWDNRKWEVSRVSTKGNPMVWKLNKNNPSSYYFVWNIHPDDQVNSIDYYLIKDRYYFISSGTHHYDPRIQMKMQVSLQEKTYGVEPIPNEWIELMNSLSKVESAKQPMPFLNQFYQSYSMYFGWLPVDELGNELFPERSVNGNGYSSSKVNLDYLMILNKSELELP